MSEPICELLPNGRYASAAVMEDIDRLERESAAKDAQLAALREALESVAVYADDLLPHIADDVRNALALVRAEPPLKSGSFVAPAEACHSEITD